MCKIPGFSPLVDTRNHFYFNFHICESVLGPANLHRTVRWRILDELPLASWWLHLCHWKPMLFREALQAEAWFLVPLWWLSSPFADPSLCRCSMALGNLSPTNPPPATPGQTWAVILYYNWYFKCFFPIRCIFFPVIWLRYSRLAKNTSGSRSPVVSRLTWKLLSLA